jgi:hypothetical protein
MSSEAFFRHAFFKFVKIVSRSLWHSFGGVCLLGSLSHFGGGICLAVDVFRLNVIDLMND